MLSVGLTREKMSQQATNDKFQYDFVDASELSTNDKYVQFMEPEARKALVKSILTYRLKNGGYTKHKANH